MRKLLFFLLFPCLSYCQIDNIRFTKTTVITNMNQKIIEYVKRNQEFIKSINGNKIIYIPYEKIFLSDVDGTYIDKFFTQYEWTFKNGRWDITVFTPKTKYYVCDFTKEKNKITKDDKLYVNDNLDLSKLINLKDKLKILKPNKIGKVRP